MCMSGNFCNVITSDISTMVCACEIRISWQNFTLIVDWYLFEDVRSFTIF